MTDTPFNAHDVDYEPGQKPKHVKGRPVPRLAQREDVEAKLARILDGVVAGHHAKMADLRR